MPNDIVALTGNPKRNSRTRLVTDGLAARIHRSIPELSAPLSIDVAAVPPDGLDEVRTALRSARVIVVGSPTYKGTFTALIKQVFDGVGARDLVGVIGVPVMVAGAPSHAHGCNSYLRPLLEEVGALVPLPGTCILESELQDVEAALDALWERHERAYHALLTTDRF